MEAETLARWQFGIVTVYHFFFVPITIGMSGLVAIMQTLWLRTGRERYLQLTKFYGKLFLINFAIGVATGIVQEFQFGMNWSEFSRFVGDIFGAPLALEGLLAFFLESTFLGLWIFGWDRLPKRIHLACIWLASLGTVLSAYFILAANSWMQNPVGYTFNEAKGRAELTDFGAVLTNPVTLVTFPHQILACYMTAGALMVAISGWHLWRIGREQSATTEQPTAAERIEPSVTEDDVSTHRWSVRFGAIVMLIAGLGVIISGDLQARVMTEVQPMKMAAAEALYDTAQPASFSVLTIGSLDGSEELFSIKVPHVLSFMATADPNGRVEGIRDIQQAYEATYGPGSYTPNIPVAYWGFRLMMGMGFAAMAVGLLSLWLTRRNRIPTQSWVRLMFVVLPFLPLFANSFGWIFTEMGRQPWVVFGLLGTASGVSPGTTVGEVATSLITFTVIYGVLAVVEVKLLLTYIAKGLPDVTPVEQTDDEDTPLSFAY
ncbi:cytochrome ubiquinol oxidase subunit I [Propionibacteriaceae bacterium Y1700]|uniref:cytochrome ubiquinol oxidase subunit I n=1 Tax=Microlunatus sp. Y1700 TaxID=3418487 RepID=UPI003DA6F205